MVLFRLSGDMLDSYLEIGTEHFLQIHCTTLISWYMTGTLAIASLNSYLEIPSNPVIATSVYARFRL